LIKDNNINIGRVASINSKLIHYDGHVCKKIYDTELETMRYIDYAILSTSIDLNNVENNAFLQAFDNIVKHFDSIDD
jgi:hypothetical protein